MPDNHEINTKKFSEKLAEYAAGQANESEKQYVEAELEKHEAINDWLYDKMDSTLEAVEAPGGSAVDTGEAAHFTRMVKRSIRRAFLKLGLAVAAVTVAAVLLVQFWLPGFVASRYYNPAQMTEAGLNRLSVDMMVYSNLRLGQVYDYATVNDRGYGEYEVVLSGHDASPIQFASRIEKGQMTAYQPGLLGGIHYMSIDNYTGSVNSSADRNARATWVRSQLQQPGYAGGAYVQVTFAQDMSLAEFGHFRIANKMTQLQAGVVPWVAVRTGIERMEGVPQGVRELAARGMMLGVGTYVISDPGERELAGYPLLWGDIHPRELLEKGGMSSASTHEKMVDWTNEQDVTTHFESLLRYMGAQEQFCAMMGEDAAEYTQAAEYIQENGIAIHGFVAVVPPEAALQLAGSQDVEVMIIGPIGER